MRLQLFRRGQEFAECGPPRSANRVRSPLLAGGPLHHGLGLWIQNQELQPVRRMQARGDYGRLGPALGDGLPPLDSLLQPLAGFLGLAHALVGHDCVATSRCRMLRVFEPEFVSHTIQVGARDHFKTLGMLGHP
jgi:hypothetical protein